VDQLTPAEIPKRPSSAGARWIPWPGAMVGSTIAKACFRQLTAGQDYLTRAVEVLNQAHDVRAHGQEMVTVDGEKE